MPARYEVDVESGVVFAFYWGEVSDDEGRSILTAMRRDPRIQSHFRTLVDCSEALTMGSGFGGTASLVDFYRSAGSGPRTVRVAFYAPRRNAVFGALRQFQMMAGGDEGPIRVFTDLAEARAWVGLPQE